MQLLQLTSVLEDEESYIVWVSITEALKELTNVYHSDPELREQITSFARKIYAKIFASIGWEKLPTDGTFLRFCCGVTLQCRRGLTLGSGLSETGHRMNILRDQKLRVAS